MINLFGQKPAHDPTVIHRIKGWTRELLGLNDEVVISVAQLVCSEEDCPEVETVIGILEPGKQRKFTVLKPLLEVTRDDLVARLRSTLVSHRDLPLAGDRV